MKSLKGTKTEQNLLKAFAGESQARMRYTYFAEKAREEGLEQVAAIFEETALNEKEHARRFFSFLEGDMVEITAAYPAGKVGTTLENLKADKEFMRLTIPRRTYTREHLRYVAESLIRVYEKRNQIKGLEFTYESPILRHFTAKFKPVE